MIKILETTIKRIQKKLDEVDFDAILLTSEKNRRYATDFASSAGVCFISRKHAHFFTDFRYIEAAHAIIRGCRVHEIGDDETYSGEVNACIKADRVGKIALEDNTLTFADYKSWEKNLTAQACPMGDFMDELRLIKKDKEIASIECAQRIAERAFTDILHDIRPGATEKQIAARLTYLMLLYGAENMSFEPIVVSGANTSKPHGVPTERKIEDGDFVTMDFGCVVDGYCSDMTRTVAVGSCSREMERVYDIVLRAQMAGIAAACAGVPGKEVDAAGRAVIEEAGYGDYFWHSFGHGVGLDIHEAPTAAPRADRRLPAGAVVTAEPGIYLPGKFGVRIEDMLLITEQGHKNLTHTPKELLILS